MTQEDIKKYLQYFSETNIIVNLEGEIELKHDALASAISQKRSKEEEELIEARQLLKSTFNSKTPLNREQYSILKNKLSLLTPSEAEKRFVVDSGHKLDEAEASERRLQQVRKKVLFTFIIFLIGLSITAAYQWQEAISTSRELKQRQQEEYIRLGNDLAQTAEYSRAMLYYRLANGMIEETLTYIQDSIKAWQKKASLQFMFDSLIQQSDSAYIVKQYSQALQGYQTALGLGYHNAKVKKKLNELDKKVIPVVSKYISNAKQFMERKTSARKKYAIELLEKALKLKPNDAEVLRLLKEYKQNQ
jgi:tetratricopeptide (TPR) repeat protein